MCDGCILTAGTIAVGDFNQVCACTGSVVILSGTGTINATIPCS